MLDKNAKDLEKLNSSLYEWINNERFSRFIKITHGNLNQLWKVNKLLAITVVQENKVGQLVSDEETEKAPMDSYKFLDMMKTVTKEGEKDFSYQFQFGWTGKNLNEKLAMILTFYLLLRNSRSCK